MYFHCCARTALFSTRRKFCEFSTGFSTLTKTSKRVTLPYYHYFVCKVLFQILYWKRSWEKFGSHTVRLQSAQNSEKTRSGENWKIILVKDGMCFNRKRICKIFSTDGTGSLGTFENPCHPLSNQHRFLCILCCFFILKIRRDNFKNWSIPLTDRHCIERPLRVLPPLLLLKRALPTRDEVALRV